MRIETGRLILRTFVESDHDDLYEFLSQLRDDEFGRMLRPRRATIEDIPALCEARVKQLVDEGLQPDEPIQDDLRVYFEKTLSDETLVEWVLEDEGKIVATAGIAFMPFPPTFSNPIGTRGYVTNMYTAPSHRGRGIATHLLALLMDEARQRGVHKIVLHASKMGRSVYKRQGFHPANGWMELDL